jgi:Tfp pilus assembly protein PilF
MARQQGNLARAADLFNSAIQANPQMVKAHVYLGAVYFQLRNLEPAIRVLEQACRIDPQDAEAWRYLGYCFERRYDANQEAADLTRASEAFAKAGVLDPQNALLKMDLERIRTKSQASQG